MNFSIVTAVTPEYVKKFKWSIITWGIKPQFKNRPLVVFYLGFDDDKPLQFIGNYFKDWTLVKLENEEKKSNKETIFGAYFFCTEFIKTPHFVKLDCDTFFSNDKDIWDKDDFNYDIVGHRWGYTKPGKWIFQIDKFYTELPGKGAEGNAYLSQATDQIVSEMQRYNHSRIASFCCLHKTKFMKEVGELMGGKMPIPSHDTVAWYFADREGKWKGKNIKKCGVVTCSTWKGIREGICTTEANTCGFLNRELMSHVQLEITTDCNLKCHNCDRNCGIAPSKEHMGIDQIFRFVDESLRYKKFWRRIDIIGGEPTMYPELDELWKIIKMYVDKQRRCTVRFSTNGIGDKCEEILCSLPDWVTIRNSAKKHRENKFTAYNSAPVDNGEKYVRCCSVPWRCGIALTRHGFFLCGAGASVARVFGLNVGIIDMIDVVPENLLKQVPELCKYCGHSNVKSRHIITEQEISPSWQKAIEGYKNVKMDIY